MRLAFLPLTIAAVLLAACGGGGGGTAVSPSTSSTTPSASTSPITMASATPTVAATTSPIVPTTVSLPNTNDTYGAGAGDVFVASDGSVYFINGSRTIVHATKQAATNLCAGPQGYFASAGGVHSAEVTVAGDGTVYSAAPGSSLAVCTSTGTLKTLSYFILGSQIAIDANGTAIMVNASGLITYNSSSGFKSTPVAGSTNSSVAEVTTPDGTVWFTSGTSIFHVVNGAVVATFPAPTNVNIADMIFAPDGSLWFCGYISGAASKLPNTAMVGRMTTAGTYAITQLPQSASSNFLSITPGSRSGTFVLGDFANNAAVLFSPPASTTTYRLQIPTGATINNIRSYADGTMWYTTSSPSNLNTLGYFTLP